MKIGRGVVVAGLGAVAFSLSGCYTVLKSPYAADDARDDARYARWEEKNLEDDPYAPTIGRFNDRDRWDSPYDYGRQGFPVFGYHSQYGAYGMGAFGSPYGRNGGYYGASPYGYGSDPYYNNGYGPYGYGYDPYYLNPDGVYVPPGYELVTTSEIERLREDIRALTNTTQDHLPTIDEEALRLQRIEFDRQTWQRRNAPRATTRTAPTTTRRETTSSQQEAPAAKEGTEKSSGESNAGSRRSRR